MSETRTGWPAAWVVGAALAIGAAGGYGLAAWRGGSAVEAAYVTALGHCATNPLRGGAELRALQRLHGEDSAPRALDMQVRLCVLEESTERMVRPSP